MDIVCSRCLSVFSHLTDSLAPRCEDLSSSSNYNKDYFPSEETPELCARCLVEISKRNYDRIYD